MTNPIRYIVTGTRNAPESFTGERKRGYKNKKKPSHNNNDNRIV